MTETTPTPGPRTFPLGDILSVTTGVMVSRTEQSFRPIITVFDHMTGRENEPYDLLVNSEAVNRAIFAQHPGLAEITPPDLRGTEPGPEAFEKVIVCPGSTKWRRPSAPPWS